MKCHKVYVAPRCCGAHFSLIPKNHPQHKSLSVYLKQYMCQMRSEDESRLTRACHNHELCNCNIWYHWWQLTVVRSVSQSESLSKMSLVVDMVTFRMSSDELGDVAMDMPAFLKKKWLQHMHMVLLCKLLYYRNWVQAKRFTPWCNDHTTMSRSKIRYHTMHDKIHNDDAMMQWCNEYYTK